MQPQLETIVAAVQHRDQARIRCPECSPTRKKKNDPCLSVTRKEDGAIVFQCWHCAFNGVAPAYNQERNDRSYRMPQATAEILPLAPATRTLAPLDAAYLASRGLSEATIKAAGLFSTKKFFATPRTELPCIAFPYRDEKGHALSHKYRTDTKHFTQDTGGASTFYGVERIEAKVSTLLITEGEIDALSLTEAGFENAVSVPNGAPMKIVNRRILASEDQRFSYVWESRELLNKMDRVVLVTDADAQGQALQEELARRIGKHKCWVVEYPEGCKDANDVLLKNGKVALSDLIIDAKPYPISALYSVSAFAGDIESLYNKRSVRGAGTGINAIDDLYTVFPGQLTVVTGLPSHGKSSFVDQLSINLATQFQWKFAMCSFENMPTIHIAHLMELKIGKPFFVQKDASIERISKEEYKTALEWVEQHFGFIDFKDTEPPTMEAILQRAQAAVQRYGIRGLVIDPYNYVKMERGASETDAISDMLTRVQAFAKANDCHVWFVAHPQKMYGTGGILSPEVRPGGGQVSGSAAWWAKADCGLTVHRDSQPGHTIIDVWKCRYRWVGQQGSATIGYDPVCGAFA